MSYEGVNCQTGSHAEQRRAAFYCTRSAGYRGYRGTGAISRATMQYAQPSAGSLALEPLWGQR